MKIEDLLQSRVFAHPVDRLQLLETHSAWVILTGPFAYKIKKSVNFGFLDFSTLERRQRFCLEELRLNRRLAPEMYLGVVPITQSSAGYAIGGTGTAVEWAIKMTQFPQQALLSQIISHEGLSPAQIDRLASQIATFHESAATADPASTFGSASEATAAALQNFKVFEGGSISATVRITTEKLKSATAQLGNCLTDVFEQRKRDGCIRECHGDLHLNNMFLQDDTITIFDGIEFNPTLRWIDVMSDLAFCLMDLEHADRAGLAHRLLNRYLEQTGDYAGLAVLNFYQAYRAMVRAKVSQLRLQQEAAEDDEDPALAESLWKYLKLTESYQRQRAPQLFLMHGLSGSGKSYVSEHLLEHCGAIRIRSDVERKRRLKTATDARTQTELYSPAATRSTYDRLADLAKKILAAGYATIVDATFLAFEERARFLDLAQSLELTVHILDCQAPQDVLEQRLATRGQIGQDPSDADLQVLQVQRQAQQPFTDAERKFVCRVRTDHPGWEEQVERLAARDLCN